MSKRTSDFWGTPLTRPYSQTKSNTHRASMPPR